MRTCKNNKECILNHVCNDYEKRLLKTISPVIKGIKPAEIISLPKSEENVRGKLKLLTTMYNNCSKIKGEIINYSSKSIKIFIYNEYALQKILHKKNIRNFLATCGYSPSYSLEDCLEKLFSRISMGKIPDEIGIFLGYPLKDVMGFMGVVNLPLTKVNYWRIYGDANISDRLYDNIQKVKHHTEKLLVHKTPQQVFELLIS
ncbi:DUF3793 family protein [Vallitalea guaymasensis]|uniref:DUF3793 family protein n=1 Tax=Vallitalea guaymasensis TaxID=1185412 RepID=A0A8J8M9N5_9FIRM|nr:DUF3793 family protein [Vallitalea guaymasensis]QUH28864.1 DUF3793 family protein [Vallitalea guaymasensis]